MVFESLVADLLNKYLGEYVDNLDRSQLKIGIWGGDVVLKDLSLKQSALDDFQLPVKTVNGFLGKLTLKIPWKNLYNAPVEASIEDLYLLVVPNTEISYDPVKEEKWKQDAKQAEINKVEEAKKKEKEKDKPKPDDTFTEKLATQIVRNVQISIKNIHIRYEDRVNTGRKPYALGITLSHLLVTTTDSYWMPNITQDATSMIYKILSIEGLSVYWNSFVKTSFLELSQSELYKYFQAGIATKDSVAVAYQYMLGPINATAKLRINSKPESDGSNFTVPKVLLQLDLTKLSVRISKSQYQDLVVLLDSLDRMSRAAPYRKYRPNCRGYKGHAKEWWKYAVTCVLEEEVRRRRRNWDWLHIQNHRKVCKEYAKAYQQKLITPRPPAEVVATCQNCEKFLDVLNIVLIRQKIEVEVERRGLLEQQNKKQGGWFSGWWGGSSKEDDSAKNDIMKQFEEAMTPAEKEKLFRAIGYQENAAPAQYPVEFVAMDFNFFLQSLEVEVRDEATQVLSGSINYVTARLQQRPAGQAIKVTVKMEQFLISGLRQEDIIPRLVQGKVDLNPASPASAPGPLLDVSFEVNPLDNACDQRVHVTSRPLHLTYDALTINKIIDVFTVEESTVISQLQTVANMKITEIKQKSALGLQHAIQKHARLDLKIDLMGFYGVVPHGGLFTGKDQALVILNLGRFLFNSKARSKDLANVQKMHRQGTAETEIIKEMLNRSYDRFVIELMNAQVKMILPGEPWKIEQSTSNDQYIIKPISLEINLDKSLIPDDHRLPKIKIYAKLPSVSLEVAETRLLSLIALLVSIPLPEAKTMEEPDAIPNLYASQASLTVFDIAKATTLREAKKSTVPEEELVQFTELEVKFELNEVAVAVFRKTDKGDIPLGDFRVMSVEAEMTQMTYDLHVKMKLGGLSLYQDYQGDKIHVINTPMAEGKEEYLFVVTLCKVSKESPEFHSKHGSVVQLIEMDFSRLDILVHQESLLDAIQWANHVQSFITSATSKGKQPPGKHHHHHRPSTPVRNFQQRNTALKLLDTIREEGNVRQGRRSKKSIVDTIDLKLRANLGEITLTLQNRLRLVGRMLIKGGESAVIMKRSYIQVDAKLRNFEFVDLRTNTKHPKVLSILGSEEALTSQVVMFNTDEMRETDNINMSVTANIACFRVVYLNYVVMSLLDFLNNFSAAQAAIIEASAAAAEAAKANMQQAYKEAYRIRLNIQLKAPIILVPANSLSHDAILIDFGVLTMLNTFQDLHIVKDDKELTAVIDNLHLELQNLKISRVKLGEDMEVAVECLLLQPISFQLTVQRNLSAWFTNVPDLDIGGRLESIHAKLTQEDYNMMMAVISQNLGEIPATTAHIATISSSDFSSLSSKSDPDKSRSGDGTVTSIDIHDVASEDKLKESVRTNIKFTFTLESLVIDLYKGGMKEIVENTCNRSGEGLAKFTLYVLSLKGAMLSDGSLTTSLLLLDCLLDDTRSSQSGRINRYMERKADETNKRSMMDITYQTKDSTSFVDMRVFSFILILNMEHLMEISEFFTVTAPEGDTPPPAPRYPKAVGSSSASGTHYRESLATPQEDDRIMTIALKLEQPDIILVENMDDINTNAIIMNVEIILKLRMQGMHLFVSGSLKDLQLFSCCFNPERRKQSKAQILRKVSMNVQGSTPPGQGLHVDISTTDLRLAVSPGTIELLNKVFATVAQSKTDSDVATDEVRDYSKLWTSDKLIDTEHWFLKTEVAEDATQLVTPQLPKPKLDEICLLTIPSMVVTMEAGVGTKTLPMLLLESTMQTNIRNWSSKLSLDSTMTLQVSYYNSRLALWEPLVEPIEHTRIGYPPMHVPWELNMQVETNDPGRIVTCEGDIADGITDILNAKPKMVITMSSRETMEITITKTCLDVLKNLGTAFNNAIFQPETKATEATAPYVVQNDLGSPVTVVLTEDVFKIYDPEGKKGEVSQVVLETGARVNLCRVSEEDVHSTVGQTTLVKEKYIQIKVPEMQCELDLPVSRADKRYFSLQHRGASNDPWGLVSDVQVQDGATVIHLRSIIQIQNHFNNSINVYFMTKKGDELELIGTVEPNQSLNLPLQAIYTPTSEFFFSVEGFSVSLEPFVWKDLQKSLALTKILQCNAKNIEDKEPFFIKVVGELEQVFHELSNRHTMASTCYNIHLRPTVVIKNFLPVGIVVCTQGVLGEKHLPAGQRMQIPTAEPGVSTVVIRITGYLDKDWSCKHEIAATPPELEVWTFQSYDSTQRITLDLGVHCVNENGSLKLALYCPFWMINKTGFMLSYRQSDDSSNILYHPHDFKGPIMFSFRAKVFFGKKKACIKLMKGEWSDKFSLDVAGSSGVVNCKVDGKIYQIGVHIQLTYNSLTKQVTFTPYHVLVNHCRLAVKIREIQRPTDPCIKVDPGEVAAFWPKAKVDDKPSELVVSLGNSTETTIPFPYNRTLNCLLKLKNKYGGVNVDVQVTEGAVYITFASYAPGMAPALIINHSNYDIPLAERDAKENSLMLHAGHKVYFAWSTTKDHHSLIWCDKYQNDLRKDEIGEFNVSPSVKLFWVSFLDGMQRILLFTENAQIARDAELAGEMEVFDKELLLCFHGLGLSLVDNVARQEVLYLGITSSGTIWETKKPGSRKFKPIPKSDSVLIEEAWNTYSQELMVGGQPNNKVAIDNILVDFATMEMQKPHHKQLRRTYNQGLWIQVKTSPHQYQLHAKVNRLQMDNQNYDCVFPVVFAPVPPPKSVNMENAMKPFAEVSVVQRVNEHSTVQQYKYFKILIQEFHIKVDIGFINALVRMFEAGTTTDDEEAEYFQEDLSLVDKSLISHVELLSSQEQKNFYDILHFSPLKIHVSFSLSGGGVQAQSQMPPVLNVLMQSLGVTLTDIHDVVLQLSYFERTYTFLNQKQLQSEVTMHYRGQLIKQLYVLVLGLDVLGNPFGLVVGITEGVQDLFYEPFQGAIQGPGEFAEGLILGVKSLFGHTVGGAAGAVSRITGAMGKGLAALTFDEEYQRKRREALNYRPTNMQEGLAQSGKGLVMGVVEGVGGVFTKPISGAKEEGVEGFFKGMGKGMMGLVTRPTAGVVDFASGSFNAVKRATEMGEEVTRLRHPRYFNTDNLVRPYCKLEADGNKLLKELDKGKYFSTDVYSYHTTIGSARCRDILLLTDKRLMVLSHNDIFGGNQIEFTYTWGELSELPTVVPKGIQIKTGEAKKRLFRSADNSKLIFIENEDLKKFLVEKMVELMSTNKGTSSSQRTSSRRGTTTPT